jgi:D-alanine-D-alanine ligase
MNKAVAKRFLAGAGIPQTPFVVVNGSDSIDTVRKRSQHLGFPLFVKPSSMGSSIGVSKVGDQDALAAAVARAGAYDDCIVIEQAVIGREIEIAVLGRRDTMVSRPGEIHVGAEFYDYHDKYTDDRATASVPADLPAAVAQRVHELALEVTSVLGCREMARCDMFVTEDGAVLLNEVNTIPGFTPISMYPKMMNDVGVSTVHILNRLVADARARHARSQQRSTAHG